MPKKERACCFVGAEVLFGEDLASLTGRVVAELENLLEQGVDTFYSGAMPGFDLLCAAVVAEMKKQYPGISLVFLPPCRGWERRLHGGWSDLYRQILPLAVRASYTVKPKTTRCVRVRNEKMLKRSGTVIAHCPHMWDMGRECIESCEANVIEV
ncbi:MAG TPA: DUF1273 family protein [Candidatus Aphodoplasma excrementigallinarum]|uniref:DUF1273 family protein n=1 Tax=Candidatus Aphodoplasma excrementigallinarum TaxID=2840673 RepID=A0A9D1NG52_9FIRM|nr:DUF1273 family protein [Candidatus Aphodoplasma excrementigallinarum]